MKNVYLFVVALLISITPVRAEGLVEGTVKTNTGEPLPGAVVVVKGASAYSVADTAGRFSLAAPARLPFTLVVSLVGYIHQELEIKELSSSPLSIALRDDNLLSETVITSRRREETAQQVPIPISVIGGALVEQSGAFNVNRIKELVPSVQLYSSNPRNTTLNIRGLGSTFGLTNDGIDPGVGFYVDGVYYARPAVTALDFIDVERIEVLRGPQGTLFGKNTTSGAFNVVTRAPGFTPSAAFEVSGGNYGFIQGKASVNAPLLKNKIALRLSFSGTHRDGTIYNTATEKHTNTMNNLGARAQLLFVPIEKVKITLAGDYTRQRPDGYAQVLAGVVETKRAAYRQFNNIIADLNYTLPEINPFNRKIDQNTPWRSGNDFAGASINIDTKLGPGTLTSTSAWRRWDWDPSNDRDFTGLEALRLSQATSLHDQWSQEIRYAGDFHARVSGVAGVYYLGQNLRANPVQIEEAGKDQWRFSQDDTATSLWSTPGLLDGYGIKTNNRLESHSAAAFGQIDWNIVKGLHVLPGIRINYDYKKVDYKRTTYGGLETTDPKLIAIKKKVYSDQEFHTSVSQFNPSGQLTVSYNHDNKVNAFATYSASFKPIGVNLGGLPTDSSGVMISLARVKPEFVNHFEVGAKTNPVSFVTLNAVFHYTEIKDYQTNVQSPELGVNRGYLANAEKVRVFGVELDASVQVKQYLTLNGSFAYTDGKYVKFTNAPLPLEETGARLEGKQLAFKDVSGGRLPGISKFAFSFGAEASTKEFKFIGQKTKFFFAADMFYRSGFSSSPSPSAFLNINGYALLNARTGLQATEGLSFFVWARNITNTKYFEQLLPGAGNAGHYAGVLGDPVTFGATLRYKWKQKI
ncbi:MAG TPA: TonB-dependent receptor [Chitinophagales bacterium]|nr:TonB-dependent receptor [Chitinophagales bacterium]